MVEQMKHSFAVAEELLLERQRQIEVENFGPRHDDAHDKGEIAAAAACYAMHACAGSIENKELQLRAWAFMKDLWPWAQHWWKPTSRRASLVKSGAMIIAEIERLDRRAAELGAKDE